MRISHRYGFVFLAYPRTASKSVRQVLDPYSDIEGVHPTRTSSKQPFAQHISASEAKKVFDEKNWDWFDYRRFCVVRNPFTRVVSLFHHYQSMRKRRAPGLAPIPKLKALLKYSLERPKSFREYVSSIETHYDMAMSLYDFIHDASGNCLVTEVLRYEQLSEELPRYLRTLGIEIDPEEIPWLGSFDIREYAKFYDEETRSIVERTYRYEIEKYGYSFEDIQ